MTRIGRTIPVQSKLTLVWGKRDTWVIVASRMSRLSTTWQAIATASTTMAIVRAELLRRAILTAK
jgi:predicted thioesterase